MDGQGPSDDEVFAKFPNVMVDRDNIDHYRAMLGRRLVIRRCADCGYWIYPHRPMCPECLSWNTPFTEVSGKGRVHMFTLINQLRDPNAVMLEPLVAAAIELPERAGLRYLARIDGCAPEQVETDMAVELAWIEQDGRPAPVFQPVRGER